MWQRKVISLRLSFKMTLSSPLGIPPQAETQLLPSGAPGSWQGVFISLVSDRETGLVLSDFVYHIGI